MKNDPLRGWGQDGWTCSLARIRIPPRGMIHFAACCLACGRVDRAPPHVRTDAVPASCLARGCGFRVLFGLRARGPCPYPCPYGHGFRVLFSESVVFATKQVQPSGENSRGEPHIQSQPALASGAGVSRLSARMGGCFPETYRPRPMRNHLPRFCIVCWYLLSCFMSLRISIS